MSTRIKYNSQNGPGREVADFVSAVSIVVAKGRRLKAKLDSMTNGDTWTELQDEIGGMTGEGQTLWGIVSTVVSKIDSPEIAELARLDQGV